MCQCSPLTLLAHLLTSQHMRNRPVQQSKSGMSFDAATSLASDRALCMRVCADLPFSKHVHSKLVCAITRQRMDEHNPPMVTPKGACYSEAGMQQATPFVLYMSEGIASGQMIAVTCGLMCYLECLLLLRIMFDLNLAADS